MINKEKVFALQNKFPGAMTAEDNVWGQVSYVKTKYFTGMMFIFGTQNEEHFNVSLRNEERSNVNVDDAIADLLLTSNECTECDREHGHKMDCSKNRC